MVQIHHNNESNKWSLLKEFLGYFKDPFVYVLILIICLFSSWIGSFFYKAFTQSYYTPAKIIFAIMLISTIVFIVPFIIIDIKNIRKRFRITDPKENSVDYAKLHLDNLKKKKEIFEENKIKLESSPHKKLIEKFVATGQLSVHGSFCDLKRLLDSKGIVFELCVLQSIVYEEQQRQEYEIFRRTILYDKPTQLRDYIVNFLDFYGEYYTDQIDFFIKLLRENQIDFNEDEIKDDIQNVVREIDLQQYEKKLLCSEKSYSMGDLDLLSGSEFELFLKELFEKMGYLVEHTKLSGDQGADLIISKFGHKKAVQAKNYTGNVGNKAIQEVVSAIKHYKADSGVVVATSDFTQPAVELAKSNDIELIDRHRLAKLIDNYM